MFRKRPKGYDVDGTTLYTIERCGKYAEGVLCNMIIAISKVGRAISAIMLWVNQRKCICLVSISDSGIEQCIHSRNMKLVGFSESELSLIFRVKVCPIRWRGKRFKLSND